MNLTESQIKNIDKAVARILGAIKSKERIILYGDADPDGVVSVIILEEALKVLGRKPARVYFSDREKEGYGINEKALNSLAKFSPALFIALDCGISNNKEARLARKMGFSVVIVDHHEIVGSLPEAEIIVNPKQKSDSYPFKNLAAAGVAYKLAKELLTEAGEKWRPEKFLELVFLATLTDQMILADENLKFVQDGISALGYTKRAGIKSLAKLTGLKNQILNEIRQKLIPALNAGGPAKNNLNETYLLLVEEDEKKAEKIAEKLIKKAELKKEVIQRIFQEIESRISPVIPIVFEGDPSWPLVLLGPAASRICQKHKKPVFLYKLGRKESPGAVRTPPGVDGVKMMEKCAKLLETYGGHPPAAGFRIKNENLEKFKECLYEN